MEDVEDGVGKEDATTTEVERDEGMVAEAVSGDVVEGAPIRGGGRGGQRGT